jgi:transcriptional/translational regulatory protein YebC/TACO1
MSGHSKWSQIKHQKGVADVKKGQVFSKLGKLISIAAKRGADPAANPTLAGAIERARAANMPKENIERAIKRASEKDTELFEITVKALTKSGVGLTIEGITDNKNRTIGEIKKILANHEAKMVEWIPDYPMSMDEGTQTLMEELEDGEDIKEVRSNANPGN